jgi:hypothetical protein
MKIVINCWYGEFSVSNAVMKELKLPGRKGNWNFPNNATFEITSDNINQYRTHTPLIEAIEKIGNPRCNGPHANLAIIKIPDDVNWEIQEYNGLETIHEIHRTWP